MLSPRTAPTRVPLVIYPRLNRALPPPSRSIRRTKRARAAVPANPARPATRCAPATAQRSTTFRRNPRQKSPVKQKESSHRFSSEGKKPSSAQRHPATRELRVRTRGERRYFAFAPRYSDPSDVASSSELDPRDACSLLRPQPRVASIFPFEISPDPLFVTSDVLNAAASVSRPAGHPRFGSIDMGAGGDSNDTVDANGDGHVNITKGARPDTSPPRPPASRLMTNIP